MRRYLLPVTPAEICRELAGLCAELVANVQPVYVPVRPESGMPANECFPLVDRTVAKHGGSRSLGWSLWEFPGVFVEAEFHAVWKSPNGELIDVTPKNRPVENVLFLPNPELRYLGRQVNNVRRPLSAAPCVANYLTTFDAEFELLNRGSRADQHGEVHLTGSEADEYASLQRKRAFLAPDLLQLAAFIGPYTPCPCNSGKKVKWCHGNRVS
jgi:hypothetical protein